MKSRLISYPKYGYNYIVIQFLTINWNRKYIIYHATYDILGMRYTFIAIYNA